MLIYEKDNKLNINFDNEVGENPDVQIGKDGDKTEVLVDGNSNPTIPVPVLPEDVGKAIIVSEDGSYTLANAGGSNAPLVLEFATENPYTVATPLADIKSAIDAGRQVYFDHDGVRMALMGCTIRDGAIISIEFAQPVWSADGFYGVTGVVYTRVGSWSFYHYNVPPSI